MSRGERNALVVGGGIGGLAAATALRQAGWRVGVLEQATSPRELGFALVLAPNAMRALRRLGIADEVRAGGAVMDAGEIRRSDGRLLRRLRLAGALRERLGEDTVCALRPVVHGALLRAAGEDALHLGCRVIDVEIGAGHVAVRTHDNRAFRARVLVGADGAHSRVRELVLGPRPLRYAGFTAWRGVAREPWPRLGDVTARQYLGTGLEAGVARASTDAVYWYLAVHAAAGGGRGQAHARREAGEHLPGLDPFFRDLVAATASEDVRRDDVYDLDPLEAWGRGAVTLLGDAAHPMTPSAGQGAAQALEDAVTLADALGAETDPEAGLRRYEQRRIPRARAMVRLSRRNAALVLTRSRAARCLRNLAVRVMPTALLVRQLAAIGPGEAILRPP